MVMQWDDEGHVLERQWQNAEGRLTMYQNGYTMIGICYGGPMPRTFYFAADGQSTALVSSEYGWRKQIWVEDSLRLAQTTCTNADGRSILTKRGYAAVDRIYQSNDLLRMKMFFDMEGNLTSLIGGEYGGLYGFDEEMRLISITCLDQRGASMIGKTG